MAGRKEFELLFKLQASLGSNFKSSFTDAKTATKDLQGTIKNLRDTAGDIKKFEIQEKQLRASTTAVENNKKELEELKKQYKETGGESDQLKQKIQQKEVQLAKSEEKVRKETESLKQLKDNLDKAGVSTANLSTEHDKLTNSIDKAVLKQEKLAQIAKAQEENKKAIAGTKKELLTLGGVAAGAAAAVYQTTVKGALEVKKGMTKLYTLADENVIPVSQMEKDILAISKETGIATQALIEDTYTAISAGQNTADATGFVLDSVKLAKAGFAETGDALDLLSTALNAYGLESKEATRISDILIMTQDLGKTSVGELSQTMGKVIPTAKANKVAMEQLGASYATMTAKGFKTADTTTYLNAMIQELGKTGSKSDKQLRATTGKTFSQLMEEGKNLAEVLEILEGSAKKSGESLGDMFSSSTAKSAALTLLSDGVEGYTKNLNAMENAQGKTQKNFEKIMQDETERMEKAKNSIKNLTNAIGSAFVPSVGAAAEKIAEAADKATTFISNNKELVAIIGKLALGLVAAKGGFLILKLGFLQVKGGIMGIYSAYNMLKGLKSAESMAKITKLVGGMKAKILPIIAIITALIVVIKLISGNLEEIREKIKNTFGDGALAIFDKVVAVFKNVAEEAKKIIGSETFQKIRDFFSSFGEGSPIIEVVKNAISGLMEFIPGLIDNLVQIAQAVLPVIMSLISGIIPIIGVLINSILPVVIELITSILPILQNIASMVLPVLTEAIKLVVGVIGVLIEYGLPILKGLLELLVPIITVLANVFTSVLHAALHNTANLIQSLTRTLGGIIDFITGVFTGNWQQAWQGVQDIFGGLFGDLVALAKAPLNLIVGAVNGVIKGLNKVKLPDWVPGIGGKGINIPTIPMLEKGSDSSPSTFIAGEEGPELITGSPGKKVFTALETGNIFGNLKQVAAAVKGVTMGGIRPRQELAIAGAPGVNFSNAGGKVIKIEHKPVFHITNGDPQEIEEALEKSNEKLKREIKDELREEREDERRTKYD